MEVYYVELQKATVLEKENLFTVRGCLHFGYAGPFRNRAG